MNRSRLSLPTVLTAPDLRRRKAEGCANLKANRLPQAVAAFTAILRECPEDVETYLWLGNCYLASRDAPTAYHFYARAQALDPDNPAVQRLLRVARSQPKPVHRPAGASEPPPLALGLPGSPVKRSNGGSAHPPQTVKMSLVSALPAMTPASPPAQAHYLLGLEVFFNARHSVAVDGKAGPIHSHSFRVTVRIRHAAIEPGQEYVLGFGIARELVQSETNQLNDTLLNNLPPYRDNPRLQPTTESLAATIFQRLKHKLPPRLRLESVTVWESPTNSVTYEEDGP